MAELKTVIGSSFVDSGIFVNGERITGHAARVVVEAGGASYLEIETSYRDENGDRQIELIRRVIQKPLEISVSIKDRTAKRLLEDLANA